MKLTEFLLARIAEEETRVAGFRQGDDPDFFWGPDRIRAECEAKRQIVDLHADSEFCERIALSEVLPYADHPDYREEWKP